MKINFNKNVVDYKGMPLIENGTKVSIKETICKFLFLGNGIEGNNSGDEKYTAYKLMVKIANGSNEVEITDKESLLIKKVCSASLNAGAYGQIVELLNK